MLTFLMLLAVVLTIPCIFCVRPMLIMLDTPVEAFEYARIYLVICMSGLIFIHGYNGVCTVLQGLGDSFHPMLFVGIACLLNILLDFFLIGWCHWDTAGAAVATVISQAVSFLSSAIYLYRRRKDFVFDFRWKHFRIVPHWLWPICKIGAPVAIQYSVINISVLFIISLVNQYGVSAAAACGVGSKIDSFFIMPINALGTAVSTAVGQNIGSRQQSRAKNVVNWSLLMALSYVAIVIAFVQLRAGMLVRLFDTTPAVVRYGILYLRIVSFGYIARAMLSCYEAMANGVGFTILTLIACITDGVLVRITLAVVFAQVMHLGLTGVFLGVLCAPYGAALISGAYFYSGRWRDQGIQGTAMDRRSA